MTTNTKQIHEKSFIKEKAQFLVECVGKKDLLQMTGISRQTFDNAMSKTCINPNTRFGRTIDNLFAYAVIKNHRQELARIWAGNTERLCIQDGRNTCKQDFFLAKTSAVATVLVQEKHASFQEALDNFLG